MNRRIIFWISLGVAVSAWTECSMAEERVILNRGLRFVTESDHQACAKFFANNPEDVAHRCGVAAFSVYTKPELDKRIGDLETTVGNIKGELKHNEQVLDDTKRAILLTIDKLPAELPTDARFYQQLRERLKVDIATDLDKAKSDIVPPAK